MKVALKRNTMRPIRMNPNSKIAGRQQNKGRSVHISYAGFAR